MDGGLLRTYKTGETEMDKNRKNIAVIVSWLACIIISLIGYTIGLADDSYDIEPFLAASIVLAAMIQYGK